MNFSRRSFIMKSAAVAQAALLSSAARTNASSCSTASAEKLGVLVDTTLCVGCRSCEKACNEINDDLPRQTPEVYKDKAVFEKRRRMDHSTYTVVNRYTPQGHESSPVYAKFQCMHCLSPACASACIVGAFTRDKSGAVIYDAWKCIGCRYCMAACPFQVPGYEFSNVLTPEVRKCTFCFEKRLSTGGIPACVQSCPMQVMTFGKRGDLITQARRRIKSYPDRYVQHIYGENEVGGTSWLYLSSVPFRQIDLPRLGYHPAPGYTEPIQHAIFKWFLPPAAVYAALGGIWWYLKSKGKKVIPGVQSE
ncbi:MAG: 4Fe-4S dicluster domain-containing protein [Deltaproteobacteria bacterium]|nr:4Fe-4S dicluster domain-containing protein [Deltaproteobacteria bacterium]